MKSINLQRTVEVRCWRVIGQVAKAGPEDLDAALRAARGAFDSGVWSSVNATDRGKVLLRAATLLETRLKKARESARGMGTERWLIMAGLNMANELAKLQVREERTAHEMGTRVRQMRERVERALVQGQQLEL